MNAAERRPHGDRVRHGMHKTNDARIRLAGRLHGHLLRWRRCAVPRARHVPGQQRHRQKDPALGFVDFVNRADILMVEPGGGLGFALEAPAGFVVAKQMRREKF